MQVFAAVLCLAVAASASHIGLWDHGHHVASGSVAVGHDGAVIAGPSGSVKTNNGLWGHGAGAQISGPSGDVATHGGHARLAGPGHEHHGHAIVAAVPAVHAVHHVAPVAVVAAPAWGHGAWGNGAWGNGAWGNGAWGNGAWGHGGAWAGHGHGAVIAHGLVGHGHHGW